MTAIFLEHDNIVEIKKSDIQTLKKLAAQSELLRARYCLHKSHEDDVQEMVIVMLKNTEIPIHRHSFKSESYHVIEGRIELSFFDDNGNQTRSIEMGSQGDGLPFICKLSSGFWHQVCVLTDYAVIHEVTSGPFRNDDKELMENKHDD